MIIEHILFKALGKYRLYLYYSLRLKAFLLHSQSFLCSLKKAGMPKQIIGTIWHFYYCLFREKLMFNMKQRFALETLKTWVLSVTFIILTSAVKVLLTCVKRWNHRSCKARVSSWVWLFWTFRCFSLFIGLKSSWVPDLEIWVSLGSRDLHWGLWSSGLHHSTFIFGSKMGFGCGSGIIPSHLKSIPRFSVLSPPLGLHSTWTGGSLL